MRHLTTRAAIVSIALSLAVSPMALAAQDIPPSTISSGATAAQDIPPSTISSGAIAAQDIPPSALSPVATIAQDIPPSVAIVVGNPSDISSWGFAPTVPLGQSVTWTNIGAQPHTVTFQGIGWDTGIMDSGAAATLVLDVPGLYTYLCTLHPTMTGNVLVSENLAISAPSMTIIEPDPGDVSSWGYALNILAGQSVTWWNADDQPHTATASDVAWDTGSILPGDASAFPFDEPGTYAYVCSPHPWMKAALQVTAAAT